MVAGGGSIIFSNGVATGKMGRKKEVMGKRNGTPECNGSEYNDNKLYVYVWNCQK